MKKPTTKKSLTFEQRTVVEMIGSELITVEKIEKYWDFAPVKYVSQYAQALQIQGFMEAVNGILKASETSDEEITADGRKC